MEKKNETNLDFEPEFDDVDEGSVWLTEVTEDEPELRAELISRTGKPFLYRHRKLSKDE